MQIRTNEETRVTATSTTTTTFATTIFTFHKLLSSGLGKYVLQIDVY